MKITKYSYRSVGKNVFRIRMDIEKDSSFGILIRYEIQKSPCNWRERFRQFLIGDCYSYGYWSPFLSKESLEDCLSHAVDEVAQKLEIQNAADSKDD